MQYLLFIFLAFASWRAKATEKTIPHEAQIGIEHELPFTFNREFSANEIINILKTNDPLLGDVVFSPSKALNTPDRRGLLIIEPMSFAIQRLFTKFDNSNIKVVREPFTNGPALSEFISPPDVGTTAQYSYSELLKTLKNGENAYILALNEVLKKSYQYALSHKAEMIIHDSDDDDDDDFEKQYLNQEILQYARLFFLKEHFQLEIRAFHGGSLPYSLHFYTGIKDRSELAPRAEGESGSYHLSITLPKNGQIDSQKLAIYSAYVLQWLEPIFIATTLYGDPTRPAQEGVGGNFRMLNNKHTTPGTVPLNICGEKHNFSVNRARQSNYFYSCLPKNARSERATASGVACYRSLLKKPLNPQVSGMDFKGKNKGDNVFSYGQGFEFRIFDNIPPDHFQPGIDLFSLTLAHAWESYGRPSSQLHYVNQKDAASASQACSNKCEDWMGPCNSWQLAVAAVLDDSYRARLPKVYIEALERNLNFHFWTENRPYAYAFEVAQAIAKTLVDRYHSHPLVLKLAGSEIKNLKTPKIALDAWGTHMKEVANKEWISLKETIRKQEHSSSLSRDTFIKSILAKNFDVTWSDAYDDILFLLEEEGDVQLNLSGARIAHVCVHCSKERDL